MTIFGRAEFRLSTQVFKSTKNNQKFDNGAQMRELQPAGSREQEKGKERKAPMESGDLPGFILSKANRMMDTV